MTDSLYQSDAGCERCNHEVSAHEYDGTGACGVEGCGCLGDTAQLRRVMAKVVLIRPVVATGQ